MSEWISAKDMPPNGLCIVQLEKPMCGMLIHCATFNDNGVNVIGGGIRMGYVSCCLLDAAA